MDSYMFFPESSPSRICKGWIRHGKNDKMCDKNLAHCVSILDQFFRYIIFHQPDNVPFGIATPIQFLSL